MSKIILHNQFNSETTTVSNYFIDQYMPAANGAFVKVYLYLLRHLSCSTELSISMIAEKLDETEKDIHRALAYWENQKLIKISRNVDKTITEISILDFYDEAPAAITTEEPNTQVYHSDDIQNETEDITVEYIKPNYTKTQIEALIEIDEIKWIMGTLEQYLERLLKPADIQLVLYLYEGLGFSAELILYLYEYCISLNKKNANYIEAVALSWAKSGIDTASKAEESVMMYNRGVQIVCKAFGINRKPGTIEKQYIEKWFETYQFSSSIVEEALNRTLLATGKPDFKYADKILSNWHTQNVKQLSDVTELDKTHQKTVYSGQAKKTTTNQASPNNKFNAFPQRKHTNEYYDSLEKHLLNKH